MFYSESKGRIQRKGQYIIKKLQFQHIWVERRTLFGAHNTTQWLIRVVRWTEINICVSRTWDFCQSENCTPFCEARCNSRVGWDRVFIHTFIGGPRVPASICMNASIWMHVIIWHKKTLIFKCPITWRTLSGSGKHQLWYSLLCFTNSTWKLGSIHFIPKYVRFCVTFQNDFGQKTVFHLDFLVFGVILRIRGQALEIATSSRASEVRTCSDSMVYKLGHPWTSFPSPSDINRARIS